MTDIDRAWTQEDFDALRDHLGNWGIVDAYLFGRDRPPVRLRIDRMEVLAASDVIGNPLIRLAREHGGTIPATPIADMPKEEQWRATLQRYDAVIGAMIISPPWVSFDDLPVLEDGRPATRVPGALCIFDIPDWTTRMALFDIGMGQASHDELARFREQYCGAVAVPTGGDVSPTAEQLLPDAVPPAAEDAPPVLVRRGDLATGAPRRGGGQPATG
jgi:hypothetical protein